MTWNDTILKEGFFMQITRDRIFLYMPAHPTERTMEDMIRHASDFGVGGVEFRSFCPELKTPDREMAKKLHGMIRERGLSVPCFSVARDLVKNTEQSVADLFAYAEICSELEIPYLHHTVALDMHAYLLTPEEQEARFTYCAEYALRVCDYANKLGVRTIIEDQGFVFNGVRNCERLCALSDDRIGIVADVGNIMFVDECAEDFILAMKDRVCHAHLKDFLASKEEPQEVKYRSRGGTYLNDIEIGTGSVNYPAVKAAFDTIGYEGAFGLECCIPKDENEAERILNFLEVL